eukprot:SAG11_NODE_236_length_11840_cov_6.566051_1_plen_93_part_00
MEHGCFASCGLQTSNEDVEKKACAKPNLMGCKEVEHNAPRANCNDVVKEVARLKWFGRAQNEQKKTKDVATNGTQVSSSPLLLSALTSLDQA